MNQCIATLPSPAIGTRARTICRRLALIGLGLPAVIASAGEPPDAGQLSAKINRPIPQEKPVAEAWLPELETSSQESSAAQGPTRLINGFRVSGNTVFPTDALLALLTPLAGQPYSFSQMQALAERITAYYRDAGYLLSRAYLPRQSLQDGILEVAVLEGRLEAVTLQNSSPISDAQAHRYVDSLITGAPLQAGQLERQLLLINDLPGVEVHSTLQPGTSTGTSALELELVPTARYSTNAGLANDGNDATGLIRADLGLTLNSLLGMGDSLSLSLLGSGPGFLYGRVAWQQPLGSSGLKAGLDHSSMRYHLGKDFSALDASGRASVTGGYLLYPLLRSRLSNLNAQLSYDLKQYDDSASTNHSDKQTRRFTLGLSGYQLGGFGGNSVLQWSTNVSQGNLTLDTAASARDSATHLTAGKYAKATLDALLLREILPGVQLRFKTGAQLANKNLDSSEKMTLTGSGAVRGYRDGLLSADQGAIFSVDASYGVKPHIQASVFVDVARARLNKKPLATDGKNQITLSSAGVGLAYTEGRINASVSLARRLGDATATGTRPLQLWVRVNYLR